MRDLIDRQAAIDALAEQIAYCDKALGSFGISMKDEYAVKVERASLIAYKERLEAIPAADVVPVVHARWNQLDNGGFVCSVCMGGYKAQPTRMGKPMFEYCPICGAKMEVEHE